MTVGAGPDPDRVRDAANELANMFWESGTERERAVSTLVRAAPWLLAQAEAAQRVRALATVECVADLDEFDSSGRPCIRADRVLAALDGEQ